MGTVASRRRPVVTGEDVRLPQSFTARERLTGGNAVGAPVPTQAGELTLQLRDLDGALDATRAALSTLEQMMCDVLAPASPQPNPAEAVVSPADSPAGQWARRLVCLVHELHAAVADLQSRLRV